MADTSGYMTGNVGPDGTIIWNTWTSGTTTCDVTTNSNVWQVWSSTSNIAYEASGSPVVIDIPPPTDEERETLRRRLEEAKRQEEERARKLRESNERALELLRSTLSPEQLREFDMDEQRGFCVNHDGRRFWIVKYEMVRELNAEGVMIRKYCINPQETIPAYDAMLAKKLMLENNPEEFFRIANVH